MSQIGLFEAPKPTRLYGTVTYDPIRREWSVECEPQVKQRLKRCFPKIHSHAQAIVLDDNLDVGRDLCWFLERYPMKVSDEDMSRLRQRERDHIQLVSDVGRMLSADYAPKGVELALPLRGYQSVAVDMTRRLKGLLLADDVGVGKTAAGIGVVANEDARPALIVTLSHLPPQWKREIEKFAPGLSVHVLKTGTPYQITRGRGKNKEAYMPDVILTNYHKLAGWADELKGKIRSVVFDEVHELRRGESYKSRAAKTLATYATYRLGMTATPIFNYGGEIHQVMESIMPGALGSWNEFAIEWCAGFTDQTKAQIQNPKAFGAYMRESGLMLRRTRRDVGRELPAITTCPHTIDADLDVLKEIEGKATELARLILADTGTGLDKMQAAEELSWRLRQATGIAKAPYVAEFIRMLVESGESVLVGAWHREVYAILEERLRDLNPVFYTGEESVAAKEKTRDAFVNGETKVMIMSLRSGAGLDGLQHVCRNVIYAELDFSPAVHEQFTGRIYRDGQPDPVMVYFLLANCGSDPTLADILGVKRGQLEGIRDPGGDVITDAQTDPDRIRKLAAEYLAQKQRAAE